MLRSSRQLGWSIGCLLIGVGIAQGVEPAASAPGERVPQPDREEVYRKVGDVELKMDFFFPEHHRPQDRRPAIVFFFGGGWKSGTPRQFFPQCRYLADRGMVATSAEYRVYDRHRAKVIDCVADAQSAVRWVRANARRLGIDPERIAAGGGSAGGHLAAATAILEDLTGNAEAKVSCRPDALVLFNPALDLTPDPGNPKWRLRIEERLGGPARQLSPADHIRPGLPPTIIFHGKADSLIAYSSIEAFGRAMREAGNRCQIFGFAEQGHGFFNYGKSANRFFVETMREAERFLRDIGYLSPATAPAGAAREK